MELSVDKRIDQQVKAISQQLAETVEVILDPSSTPEQRRQASKLCEEFKDNSTCILLTNCGIYLYNTHHSPSVKHLGLQLIQQAVKFQWNVLSVEEKSNLKLMSLQFVAMGSGPLLEEPPYIKDAIAKLTVEIMMREWPQNWPDVFTSLSNISLKGECQLFVVLRVLLRLAEEVTATDNSNLPAARRKEMMTALSNILDELFNFFIKTLQLAVKEMKKLKTHFGDSNNREVLVHKVLSEAILSTLSGYVAWVNTKHLEQDNAVLLELLCFLLEDDELRMSAAECLELIVSRKGKLIERKPLLILFNVDAIKIMYNSATCVVTGGVLDEKTCSFLKRVCNILSILGHLQLASIWGSAECGDQGEPAHFKIYLEALISLYQQKNMLMTDLINKVWLSFLKNPEICKNETFRTFIPRIMEVSKSKLSRAGNPDISSLYFEMDFASATEMQELWKSVRSNTRVIIREITGEFPAESFLQAATWLLKLVDCAPSTEPVTESSEYNLEWDSMTVFLHSVLSRVFSKDSSSIKEFMLCQIKMKDSSLSVCELGKKCIDALVPYNTKELLIMSSVLSCLEALLPLLEFLQDILLSVISKIFNALSFVSPFKNPSDNNQGALEFRRHAAAIWIRLCLMHKKLLIEIINDLTKHIQTVYSRNDFNSQERALLTEGLAIISNGYMNYEKQKQYLSEILAPIKEMWMSEKIEQALSSSENLIAFVGLDQSGEDQDIQCNNNRFQLHVCLRFIHAVLKRVEPPQDSQDQINGGFKEKHEDDPLNPCTSLLLPLLSNFFHLTRVLNSIWHPSVLPKVSPFYKAALGIHDSEKAAIFGLAGSEEKSKDENPKRSNVHSMKTFLFKMNEICATILSDCSRLDYQFYGTPSLGQLLVNFVIETWRYLPNYRNFLKHYCRMCPPRYYDSAVIPVISSAITITTERLNKEWEKIRSRESVSPYCGICVDDLDEDENEDKSEEVIEGQLIHLLTKNFMEAFFNICIMAGRNRVIIENEEALLEASTEVTKQQNPDDILEGLVKYLLQHPETCKLILLTPFIALQWQDSSSFVKAAKLCVPFVKQIVQHPPSGVAMEPSMFQQLFTLLLKGLQLMGHNVEMQTQLIRSIIIIYDTLRPLFPELKSVLLQVPDINASTIDEYDKSLFSETVLAEKQKKKVFKGILAGLIGKEVGKMFQDDITILNLPAPNVAMKPSPVSLEDSEAKDIGLIKLFEPDETNPRRM